ncbi:hypothetical protein [Leifsonella bigeumensis]|uniref:hypothetical protein n=1 Tax=Leifsonella bigeumensis TaxID=433643 RepID=UPI0031D18362
MATESSHSVLADRLRRRVVETGVISAELREGAMHAGGAEHDDLGAPYDVLARTIGTASYRVTDAQVGAVREAAESDQAAFEIVMSASVGAGLKRWDAAARAIREAADAAR